jgi:hypothetical protein
MTTPPPRRWAKVVRRDGVRIGVVTTLVLMIGSWGLMPARAHGCVALSDAAKALYGDGCKLSRSVIHEVYRSSHSHRPANWGRALEEGLPSHHSSTTQHTAPHIVHHAKARAAVHVHVNTR